MDQEPRAVVCRAATYRRCGQERIRVKKKIQRFMLVARILEKWKMSKKKIIRKIYTYDPRAISASS
jgi:hypothetical protein